MCLTRCVVIRLGVCFEVKKGFEPENLHTETSSASDVNKHGKMSTHHFASWKFLDVGSVEELKKHLNSVMIKLHFELSMVPAWPKRFFSLIITVYTMAL